MNSDDDAFRSAMVDVAPLKREKRVRRGNSAAGDDAQTLQARRQAAAEEGSPDPNPLTDTQLEPLDAWYVLDFKRPGVQNGVYRKLKQGRYEAQGRLDLHRMTVARARREIFEFVAQAYDYGLRSVLVIHGKGETRADKERCSILKGGVDRWLRELETVQAFHSARPQHGGTGAVYVLLRKSEDKKRETREQFTRG
ncbi:MAG: DNA endonuclease SmrA [Halioglobus sp.]|nr:DNA endonuclease SmrA [Halioglobus sp.]